MVMKRASVNAMDSPESVVRLKFNGFSRTLFMIEKDLYNRKTEKNIFLFKMR